MKIAVYSDLHRNYSPWMPPQDLEADVVIAAGDIHDGPGCLRWLAETFEQPVAAVLGNHDFYGMDLATAETELAAEAKENGLCLLNRSEARLAADIRLIGCTLWTDFACFEARGQTAADAMDRIRHWEDYSEIALNGKPLTPEDVVELHRRDRAWLEKTLRTPFEGQTIVVTHHAPSTRSIRPDYADSPYGPYYVVDLEHLIEETQPDIWIHGHTHHSLDYRIGTTRVLSNQRGRPDRTSPDKDAAAARSRPFQERLVLEI